MKDGKVIIKTTDGNTYCADHVIVTIPLGVLKEKYNTLFNPPLPKKNQDNKGLFFSTKNLAISIYVTIHSVKKVPRISQ